MVRSVDGMATSDRCQVRQNIQVNLKDKVYKQKQKGQPRRRWLEMATLKADMTGNRHVRFFILFIKYFHMMQMCEYIL